MKMLLLPYLKIRKVTGRREGADFEYVKDIGYDERGRRAYIEYGNGSAAEERYGGHNASDTGSAEYRYEDGIYSTDYGFALTRPGSGNSGGNGIERYQN